MPSRAPNRNAVCLAVLLLAVAADQITKWWARSALADGRSIALVGRFLRLELVRNPGAAFSVGSGRTWMFTVLAVVILGAMAWLYRRSPDTATRASIALLAGGAVGNLIDRLFQPPSFGQGHVIDFIGYGDWFVGNVADIWIVVAAAALVLSLAREGGGAAAHAENASGGAQGGAAGQADGSAERGGAPEASEGGGGAAAHAGKDSGGGAAEPADGSTERGGAQEAPPAAAAGGADG